MVYLLGGGLKVTDWPPLSFGRSGSMRWQKKKIGEENVGNKNCVVFIDLHVFSS